MLIYLHFTLIVIPFPPSTFIQPRQHMPIRLFRSALTFVNNASTVYIFHIHQTSLAGIVYTQQQLQRSLDPNTSSTQEHKDSPNMCVEHHHLLACGHYDESHLTPYEVVECQYPSLTDWGKAYFDRVNGQHRILYDEQTSMHYDMSAICEECREEENVRARRRQPLKWPDAKETI